MATKWITKAFSGAFSAGNQGSQTASDDETNEQSSAGEGAADSEEINYKNVDLNKAVVLLLYGKNSFGDKVYSYLKITLGNIEKMKAIVLLGQVFNPSDFGTVIAAGRGEPSDEVRSEISSLYHILSTDDAPPPKSSSPSAPAGKKSWDEY